MQEGHDRGHGCVETVVVKVELAGRSAAGPQKQFSGDGQ